MKLVGVLTATVVAVPLRYAPKDNCECPEAVKAFLSGEDVKDATGFLEVDDCCVDQLGATTVNAKSSTLHDTALATGTGPPPPATGSSSTGSIGPSSTGSAGPSDHKLWPKSTPGHSCSQYTDCSSCTAYALCQWGGPHVLLGNGTGAQYVPDYKCTDSYGIPPGEEDLYSNDCSSHVSGNTKPAELVEDFTGMQNGEPFHSQAAPNMTMAPKIIRHEEHAAWPSPFDGYLPAASMCAGSHYHPNCGTAEDPHSMAYIKPHHYTDRPIVDFAPQP